LAVKTHRDSLMDMSSRSETSCSCRSVRFDTVEFREYPVILCDNPSASGPPIGLGWEYDPEDTLQAQLDDYESHRHGDDRRTKSGLRIPPNIREDKLLQAGYSRSEIRSVVQMSEKEKERRRSSLVRKQRIGPILKGVENIKLGFKRSMSLPSLHLGKNDCSSQDSDFHNASQHPDFLDASQHSDSTFWLPRQNESTTLHCLMLPVNILTSSTDRILRTTLSHATARCIFWQRTTHLYLLIMSICKDACVCSGWNSHQRSTIMSDFAILLNLSGQRV
jgi:hypothetical protein